MHISFQHTEDLDVADRFIRLASGSNAAGDGGIAIQQNNALNAEVFGFDSGATRWGVSSSCFGKNLFRRILCKSMLVLHC